VVDAQRSEALAEVGRGAVHDLLDAIGVTAAERAARPAVPGAQHEVEAPQVAREVPRVVRAPARLLRAPRAVGGLADDRADARALFVSTAPEKLAAATKRSG
jgi:hypothetical protein